MRPPPNVTVTANEGDRDVAGTNVYLAMSTPVESRMFERFPS
jgi:hypothetical protein